MINRLSFREFFTSMFFPKRCRFCGKIINPHFDICQECEESDFRIEGEICSLCGFQKNDCVCKKKKNSYSAIYSPFYYQNAGRKAVLRLKHSDSNQSARFLAEDMASFLREHCADCDFDEIAFVPLTEKQERLRGFNHSELLAKELSKQLGIPSREYLVKLYENEPQHILKESLRKGNVLGVFDVVPVTEKSSFTKRGGARLTPENKTILLCDDVKTTGATLNECAKMLLLAGAKEVRCVTATVTKKQVDKNR